LSIFAQIYLTFIHTSAFPNHEKTIAIFLSFFALNYIGCGQRTIEINNYLITFHAAIRNLPEWEYKPDQVIQMHA